MQSDNIDTVLIQHQIHAQGLTVFLDQFHAGNDHIPIIIGCPFVRTKEF